MNETLKAALVKKAQEVLERRDLDRKERKTLFAGLPEHRKKQIAKFIAEQINKNREKKSYIVDTDYGEATYTPATDRLEKTMLNVAAEQAAARKRQGLWNWANSLCNTAILCSLPTR